ncbi:MAG: hypothetical protein IPL26_26265 [Leptospiraceae bacterium]|nr:hypothetical protein [Leptospiraceae bacterium]
MGKIIQTKEINGFQLVVENKTQGEIEIYFIKNGRKSQNRRLVPVDIVHDYIFDKKNESLIGIDVLDEAIKSMEGVAINSPEQIIF